MARNKNLQKKNNNKISCYLSCNALKYKIKRIGHRVRLRDIIVSSYPIIPVYATFHRNRKHIIKANLETMH